MGNPVQKNIEEVDNYEQSLNAVLALLHLYKYDDDARSIDAQIKSWFGKKMGVDKITPDLIMQLNSDKGVITELKRSFPKNDKKGLDLWEEEFKQLKTYDANLSGWETKTGLIKEQDLLLLTSQKLGVHVCDYIKEKKLNFTSFSKKFAVVQFNPTGGTKPAVYLQKIGDGEITDFKRITNSRLRAGVPIEIEYLLQSGLSKVKFVDHPPNVIYLMSILWDFVFSTIPSDEDWRSARESKGGKIVEIPVAIEKIKEILSNFTLNGDNQGLKNDWIREAMENFVKLKLAKKGSAGADYVVKFRKKIKDEHEGENKHKVFAELLFGEGVQTQLDTDFAET